MNVITNVPESGIYIQRGAIAKLIAQLIDLETGLPILLQAATALFMDVVYPDRAGTRTFPAQLYTDGSDGKIVYTTQNNGLGYSDLNQTGLYNLQGRASIGNVPLPPSYVTDFYVLGNAADLATTPVTFPVLRANDGKFWQIYILRTGQLDILQIDATTDAVDTIYMVDSAGQNWTLVAMRTGPADANLVTTPVTGPFPADQQFYVVDSIKKQWVVNVLAAGNTTTN
jgi:hypothetical protein